MEGLRDLARRTGYLKGYGTITLASSSATYTLATDVLWITDMRDHNGRPMSMMTVPLMNDFHGTGWRDSSVASADQVDYWIPEGHTQVRLYPRANSDASGESVPYEYAKQPATATASGDIPEIPREHHNAAVFYALGQMFEWEVDLQNQALANKYQSRYMAIVSQAKHEALFGRSGGMHSIPWTGEFR